MKNSAWLGHGSLASSLDSGSIRCPTRNPKRLNQVQRCLLGDTDCLNPVAILMPRWPLLHAGTFGVSTQPASLGRSYNI